MGRLAIFVVGLVVGVATVCVVMAMRRESAPHAVAADGVTMQEITTALKLWTFKFVPAPEAPIAFSQLRVGYWDRDGGAQVPICMGAMSTNGHPDVITSVLVTARPVDGGDDLDLFIQIATSDGGMASCRGVVRHPRKDVASGRFVLSPSPFPGSGKTVLASWSGANGALTSAYDEKVNGAMLYFEVE
jgi:hypothetical protein